MDGASRGSTSWNTLLRNVRERMGGAPGAPPTQSAPAAAQPPAVRVPLADAAGSSDAFPQVSDAQLRALFPGCESNTTSESRCVRAALVEMERAYVAWGGHG